MKPVKYDSFARGARRQTVEVVSGLHFFLMFLAAGLLVLTRVEHPLVLQVQSFGRELVQPVLTEVRVAARPVRRFAHNVMRYFTVESEFRRLERELVSLRQLLERTSDLAKRNEELGQLAKLVRTAPVDAVTVEVIAGARGLFGKSVMIGAGKVDGVRYGQPVFGDGGLFGRIISVEPRTARVLVLNDINSRIPVAVGPGQHPALLVGDNTDRPRLVYASAGDVIREGEEVVTSGASGEFPRGIKVGRVDKSVDDVLRVETAARLLAGTYLTVLRYQLPSSIAVEPKDVTGASAIGSSAQ